MSAEAYSRREKNMNYNMNAKSDMELFKTVVRESRSGAVEALFEDKHLPDIIYNMTQEELLQVDGVGLKTAEKILAVQEMMKRIASGQYRAKRARIKSPDDVYSLMKPVIGYLGYEEFYVLLLNTKNEVIHQHLVSRGSLNASIVHPREVFKEVIKRSAACIVLVHNHPSQHPEPSKEDISITERLVEAGQLLGIKVLDHIIIGNQYYSFKENDLI